MVVTDDNSAVADDFEASRARKIQYTLSVPDTASFRLLHPSIFTVIHEA